MKKVLRVCSYPTSAFESMGMNSYIISGMKSVKTIYITPQYEGDLFPEPHNCTVIPLPFLTIPAPTGFLKIIHEIKRSFVILGFSLQSILILLKEKPDIVHIHSPMYFLIALFAKIQRKICYITYHGNEHKRIYSSLILGGMFNRIFKKTFALSSSIEDYGVRFPYYKNKYISISNSVNTKIFFNRGSTKKKIIVAVGRLEIQKDYPSLLLAFAKFNLQFPDYKMFIAGSGSLEADLKKIAADIGIDRSVTFLGKVSQKEICNIYNESEIFVLTSLWEGFPKVLLEAIACGCKVVATRVDSIPKIMGYDYPYLVNPGDVDDIHTKMCSSVNDEKMKSRYDDILNSYNWDEVIEMMEDEYNK